LEVPIAQTPKVTVEEFMVTKVFRITPDLTLLDVAELFLKKGISGAPVVDGMDRVLTVLGEGATLRLAATEGLSATVAHCLPKLTPTDKIVTLQRHATFQDAYRMFLKHNIHRIPIVDANGILKGIISRSLLFRIFVEAAAGKKIPPKS
jgi:CBS domain-containing protein